MSQKNDYVVGWKLSLALNKMKHRLYDSNVPKQMIFLELNWNFIAFSDHFGNHSVIKNCYYPCICCRMSPKYIRSEIVQWKPLRKKQNKKFPEKY